MNRKCYKSAILVPIFLLILTRRLKRCSKRQVTRLLHHLHQAGSKLRQSFFGELPRFLKQIAAPLLLILQFGDARLALGSLFTGLLSCLLL